MERWLWWHRAVTALLVAVGLTGLVAPYPLQPLLLLLFPAVLCARASWWASRIGARSDLTLAHSTALAFASFGAVVSVAAALYWAGELVRESFWSGSYAWGGGGLALLYAGAFAYLVYLIRGVLRCLSPANAEPLTTKVPSLESSAISARPSSPSPEADDDRENVLVTTDWHRFVMVLLFLSGLTGLVPMLVPAFFCATTSGEGPGWKRTAYVVTLLFALPFAVGTCALAAFLLYQGGGVGCGPSPELLVWAFATHTVLLTLILFASNRALRLLAARGEGDE